MRKGQQAFRHAAIGAGLLLLCGLHTAAAQERRLEVLVEDVAGDNAYLDAGTEAGIAGGDTLRTFRPARDGGAERLIGAFVVVGATARRTVVAFAEAPFAVTRGERLVVALPDRAASGPAPAPPIARADSVRTPAPAPARPSILAPATTPARRAGASAASGPRLDGRLQVGMNGLSTRTDPGEEAEPVSRTFATPFASLRAGVDGLPGGLRLDANLRGAYRYAGATPFDQPADLRVYELAATLPLARAFGAPLELRAGRFVSRYDRVGGYWDGASLHVGTTRRGVGVAAGFQPEGADGMPSGTLPKVMVFGHTGWDLATTAAAGATRPTPLRVDVSALVGGLLPQGDTLQARVFVGAQASLAGRGLSLTADALTDQDPASGAWTFSRLSARASVPVAQGLRLTAHAVSRRPYLLFGDTQVLLARSTRVGGGASVVTRGGPLPGLSGYVDLSRAQAEGVAPTLAATGGFTLPRLPGVGLGLAADASTWAQEAPDGTTRRGLNGGVGVTRAFGAGLVRVGYRHSRSPVLLDHLVTHGLEGLLQLPLTPRLSATVQASTQLGGVLTSTRLYTALWVRL